MMLLWLVATFWIGWVLVYRWFQDELDVGTMLIVAYPLGLVLQGGWLYGHWLAELPLELAVWTWFMWAVLAQLWWWRCGPHSYFKSLLERGWKQGRQAPKFPFGLFSKFSLLGLPLYGAAAVAAASGGVFFLWHTIMPPLSWDATTLYAFRADRIAEGWFFADFAHQFAWFPVHQAYDFLHPMVSSLWWSAVASWGGQHPLAVYVLVWIGLILLGGKVFANWPARVAWMFGLFALPPWTEAMADGYGSLAATLFFGYLVLWLLWRWHDWQWMDSALAAAWLVGTLWSRTAEYFWVMTLLVIGAGLLRATVTRWQQVRSAWWRVVVFVVPPLLVGWQWAWLRQRAARVAATTVADRSLLGLGQSLAVTSPTQWAMALASELWFVVRSPLMVWLVIAVVGVMLSGAWKKRQEAFTLVALLLLSWIALLLLGMTALNLSIGPAWEESRKAFDRGTLSIWMLTWLLICWSLQSWSINPWRKPDGK